MGFGFLNLVQVLNHLVDIPKCSKWLPFILPEILKQSKFPANFATKLQYALSIVDKNPEYQAQKTGLLIYLFNTILEPEN